MSLQKNIFYKNIMSRCIKKVIGFILKKSYLGLMIQSKHLIFFLNFMKKNSVMNFRLLMDIFAIDKPFMKHRFLVIYKLNSLKYNYTIFLNVYLYQNQGLNSALSVFSSAGWLEREVWDFFGIYFYNHNDLRRILTDYGFSGFPLRKDFPLSGYFEVNYMDEKKRVILEPLDISQEFRFFDFSSPWE